MTEILPAGCPSRMQSYPDMLGAEGSLRGSLDCGQV